MIISFFEITDKEKEEFEKALPNDTLNFFEKPIQDVNRELYIDSEIVSVFIYSRVTEDELKGCINLKLVCTRSTGMDHIDTEYCSRNNIVVKNVPVYGENTVAEHTFALMLSLSRKINKSYHRVSSGKFSTDGLQGFDLKDKTIGIIRRRKDRAKCV